MDLDDRISRLENIIGSRTSNQTIVDEIKRLEDPLQNAKIKQLMEHLVELEFHRKYKKDRDPQGMKSIILESDLESILKNLKKMPDVTDFDQQKQECSIETFGIRERFKEFMEFSIEFRDYYQSVSKQLLFLDRNL